MNSQQVYILTVYILYFLVGSESAVPKYEATVGKLYAGNKKWPHSNGNENRTVGPEEENTSTKQRLQRLGYTTGYGTINNFPGGTGLATYNPIKLDLGGVVLGTLVGIGAIIIIPKILNAFHGSYTGYGRSEHEESSSVTFFMSKIDEILGQHNIDSTNCMQRAVCSYVRSTEYKMRSGATDKLDKFVHILSENSLVDYILDGTAIKEALENGRNLNSKACDELYINCPVDSKAVTNILKLVFPQVTGTHSNTA